MNDDRRTLIILLANGLLYFVLNQVNEALAPLSLHISLDALFLLFAFFYLKPGQALLIGLLTALFVDAALPVPFGIHVILIFGTLAFLQKMRRVFRRENPRHVLLAALWCNLFIMLGLSLTAGQDLLMQSAFWLRFLCDLALSQLALALLASWWLNLQRKTLLMWEIDVGAELRRF